MKVKDTRGLKIYSRSFFFIKLFIVFPRTSVFIFISDKKVSVILKNRINGFYFKRILFVIFMCKNYVTF